MYFSYKNNRVIPKSIRKVTVTKGIIAGRFFANCSFISEIILEDGVTSID
jgi:hypothetical protein